MYYTLRLAPPSGPPRSFDLGWAHLMDVAQVHLERVLVGRPEVALVALERFFPLVHRSNVSFQPGRGERGEVAHVALVPPATIIEIVYVVRIFPE